MKGLAIVNIGTEKISAKEIKELIKAESQTEKGAVVFDLKEMSDLCVLCYKAQSVSKIVLLLKHFKINEIEDLKQIEEIDLSEWIDSKTTFSSRCVKADELFSTKEIEAEAGERIINNIKNKTKRTQKVSLENPDVVFLTFVSENDCYFGIDFSGVDLSKRSYKIFGHQRSLKGTIAYSLLRTAGYSEKKILLDPFCNDGTIPIETAAFASGFPINYYEKNKFAFLKLKVFKGLDFDKFFEKIDQQVKNANAKIYAYDSEQRLVKTAEKNAKISGVMKHITFSRTEAEWLDIKFKEKEIDLIVTNPPRASKNVREEITIKIFRELFYQADYILKKEGKVVVIGKDVELLKQEADKYNFKPVEEHEFHQGQDILNVIVFGR